MNNKNIFYLMVDVVLAVSYQLVGIGPKPSNQIIYLSIKLGKKTWGFIFVPFSPTVKYL